MAKLLMLAAHAPIGAALGGGVLLLAAWAVLRLTHQSLSGWALLLVLLPALGAILGGLIGACVGADRAVRLTSEAIRSRLEAAGPLFGEGLLPQVAVADLRARYEEWAESTYASLLGSIPLPGLFRRLTRSWVRDGSVDNFLDACEGAGVTHLGATELRNWLVAHSLGMASAPLTAQLAVWRWTLTGVLGLLAIVPLAVAIVVRLTSAPPAMPPV